MPFVRLAVNNELVSILELFIAQPALVSLAVALLTHLQSPCHVELGLVLKGFLVVALPKVLSPLLILP